MVHTPEQTHTAEQQRSKPQIKETKRGNKDTNRELQVRCWAQNLREVRNGRNGMQIKEKEGGRGSRGGNKQQP